MCIGETSDTLDAGEQAFLSAAAAARFPTHEFALHSNDDGITWALLTPAGRTGPLPKITICRVAPCIMVMLEDRHDRRQFRSLPNVQDAVEFIHAISDEALLSAAGLGDTRPTLN